MCVLIFCGQWLKKGAGLGVYQEFIHMQAAGAGGES
jgi:hypothetical protein